MNNIMILVADSSRARVLVTDSSRSPLEEIETMAHPAARLHEQQMVSDLPGRNQNGHAGHAFQNKVAPKEQEVIYFAKKVATYLDQARNANKLKRLLLVAAPDFLGQLRKHLSSKTHEHVVFELAKDLTMFKPEKIRSHLPKYLTG